MGRALALTSCSCCRCPSASARRSSRSASSPRKVCSCSPRELLCFRASDDACRAASSRSWGKGGGARLPGGPGQRAPRCPVPPGQAQSPKHGQSSHLHGKPECRPGHGPPQGGEPPDPSPAPAGLTWGPTPHPGRRDNPHPPLTGQSAYWASNPTKGTHTDGSQGPALHRVPHSWALGPPYLEHLAVMFTGSQGLLQLNVLVLGAGKAGTALGQGLRQTLHLVPQEALTLLHLGQGSAQPLYRQLQSACLPLAVCHLGEDGSGSPGVPEPSPATSLQTFVTDTPGSQALPQAVPTAAWPEAHCQLSALLQGTVNPVVPEDALPVKCPLAGHHQPSCPRPCGGLRTAMEEKGEPPPPDSLCVLGVGG